MGTCSSGPSQKGASPSPTSCQYPDLRDSNCSSVHFCKSASTRKFIPREPRNWDWVIGPWTETSPVDIQIKPTTASSVFTLTSRWKHDTKSNTMRCLGTDLKLPRQNAWWKQNQHKHWDQQILDHPECQQIYVSELPETFETLQKLGSSRKSHDSHLRRLVKLAMVS